MRKFFLFIVVGILMGVVPFSHAHPLDVSNTTITIYPDSIIGVTYLHPVELDRILVLSGGVDPAILSVDTYYSMTGTLTKYLNETLSVENNGQKCTMGHFEVQTGFMIDELFRSGLPISYTIDCSGKISNPIITINICNEVQLQTNRLYIYESDGGVPVKKDYRVLNVRKNSQIITLGGSTSTLLDTDHDGVPDEDEILYRTDPHDPDTDHDGYSDREEIDKSWDPLSKSLSPGQVPFSPNHPDTSDTSSGTGATQGHSLVSDNAVWGGERFAQVLKLIRLYIDDHGDWRGYFFLLFSVGFLGFIHALGPGHSKGVLISQILDHDMSFAKGILYSFVFSLIHIVDIVVVVIVSKFFLKIIDPGKYLGTIQSASIILILMIAIYLFVTSLRTFLQKSPHDSPTTREKKKGPIILAVITGLTPCAFGWSIFLMLFAVKRIDLALPILCSLGLGIFLCLLLISGVTFALKEQIYRFAPRIGYLSPIISSFFLFLIGSGLLISSF